MTIETDIVAWALERPAWQQKVLVRLADGQDVDNTAIGELADELLPPDSNDPSRDAKGISLKSDAVQQVQIVQIANTVGVNALLEGQRLAIASTGLTVIYGDNGSGKSGYARIIKSLVSARHATSVLPNVFEDKPEEPSADLVYTVGGVSQTQKFPGAPTPELLKVTFYDEHCGDEYVTKQSTISYRPSALTLLDGLIAVCDRVQGALKERLRTNQLGALNLDIPPQTVAGAFVVGLTASTTDDQIDQATQLAEGITDELAALLTEEARLTSSDAVKEQARLNGLSARLNELAVKLDAATTAVSPAKVQELSAAQQRARALRAAASIAAGRSFDGEPLTGVGSETWRALWEAAKQYSLAEAYHDHPFPVTDEEARCVFCQQPLSDDARSRLNRFEQFMGDTTERDATQAEAAHTRLLQELSQASPNTPEMVGLLNALSGQDVKLATSVQALVAKIDEQRAAILAYFRQDAELPAPLPEVDLANKIEQQATDFKTRAEATDVEKFRSDLAAIRKRKQELQANIRLCESAEQLKQEVRRLRQAAQLTAAKSYTDTKAITAKSTQLTRDYATALILDQFTRETERLRLQRVTLQDMGGQKGRLSQQPGLLGAKHRGATARAVLSEGEQTALGLAGFFTEAEFDVSKSAIVFDDPVTSLDHIRRDKVAERLAQLAKERQVIVFTHDVNFTGDLAAAAESEHVPLAERCIERRGTAPGVCRDAFPWKAKDFGSRLGWLDAELAKLKKDRPGLSQEAYEERVASWSGHLSEMWERAAITEIMNQVFDRGRSEVRVMKFRVLAQITESDGQDYQDGYGKTSKWARRHDKAPETNYVAPEPDELEAELKRLRDWQKRIKSYLAKS
jgi:energy-coupling factor transporter ATP-binding protein EcfA2